MKIKNIFITLFILTLFTSSCGDSLADLNIDPNSSPTADATQVLTAGMGYAGIALDGYYNETDALFSQYWAGGPGVALLDHERYFIEPGDFSTEWSFANLQSLSDLDFVIDTGNPLQATVADIMSVYIYQLLVDHYGDIPYSEALKGALEDGSILTPKYDDAATIYADLISRMDKNLENLYNDVIASEELGSEDLVYSGDVSKWIKFASSLKLKLQMRISDVSDQADGVRNLINSGDFITSVDDIALIPFDGDVGNWNPQYARREQGIGMFYVASNSFVKVLSDLQDPRLNTLFDPSVNTGIVEGMIQGNVDDLVAPSKDDFSFPSAVAYSNDNDVILMSNWEVMFLRAEAAAKFGTIDDETTMFNDAIRAHFDYTGTSGASDYLENSATYDASLPLITKLNLIGVQKWISMCGLQEAEGWIESRRFDASGSNVFTNTGSGIFTTPTRTVLGNGVYPSIRLYPQSELSYNPNTPSGRSITDRVFWDN